MFVTDNLKEKNKFVKKGRDKKKGKMKKRQTDGQTDRERQTDMQGGVRSGEEGRKAIKKKI